MKFIMYLFILWTFSLWAQDESSVEDEALITENEISQEQNAVEGAEKDIQLESSTEETADTLVEEPDSETQESSSSESEDSVSEPSSVESSEFESVDSNIEAPVPAPVIEEENSVSAESEDLDVENQEPLMSSVKSDFGSSDFESRLYKIYNQFYRETISDDAWKQIAGEKINESYAIQEGDTLWDISVTFFGNGHYWPKVWQLNDDITNPHIISSGYQLRFVPGTLTQSPQLNLTQSEDPNSSVKDSIVTESEDQQMELTPVIPPPTKKSRTVLQELPPSLPYIKNKKNNTFDSDGFSKNSSVFRDSSPGIYLTSYLSDSSPSSLGVVGEMEISEVQTASLYDQLYLKLNEDVPLNEKLLIYKTGETISSKKGVSGVQIFFSGEVRILERKSNNIYKAMVIKSIAPIEVGSLVSRGSIPYVSADEDGEFGSGEGIILGGDYEKERYMMGQQQVLYIDKGSDEGVQFGQIFYVKKEPKLRNSDSILKDIHSQIAKIKIVKTDNKFSTAILLGAKEEVRPGDRFASAQSASFDSNSIESDFQDSSTQDPELGTDEDSGDDLIEE